MSERPQKKIGSQQKLRRKLTLPKLLMQPQRLGTGS